MTRDDSPLYAACGITAPPNGRRVYIAPGELTEALAVVVAVRRIGRRRRYVLQRETTRHKITVYSRRKLPLAVGDRLALGACRIDLRAGTRPQITLRLSRVA